MFKLVSGILLALAGIIVGLYVGVWVCFIGGITGVITEIRAENLSAMNVAINIAKILFSGAAGWGSFALLFVPGKFLINSSTR